MVGSMHILGSDEECAEHTEVTFEELYVNKNINLGFLSIEIFEEQSNKNESLHWCELLWYDPMTFLK